MMRNLTNNVILDAERRNEIEDRHKAAYRHLVRAIKEHKVREWQQLGDDTQRELTFHRLSFEGLDVIDSDIYNFQSALAGLFSNRLTFSATEKAEALNNLKSIVYAQMESLFNRELEHEF